MRTHSRKTWPLFLTDVILILVGAIVSGTPGAMILAAGVLGLLATAIYALAGEDVQDGLGGIGGGLAGF